MTKIKDLPLTIKDTHEGLLAGDFSCVDLVDKYLETIKEKDDDINSFNTVTDEIAYEQAKEADRLIKDLGEKAFEDFPLLGVCVAHKDMYLTEGVRTTASSRILDNYIPQYSATVVKRMEKAGAIMLGKTNCDAFAHGASGENSDYGVTQNPWDKSLVPGGSSSGSAAAMAGGMALVTTGTDTGGSIRQPASFTYSYGFKPTYGAVPRYGTIAMASSTDSMGHFARTIDDVERVFKVTRGPDGKDSTVVANEYKKKEGKLKIGLPKEYFVEGLDKEIEEKVREVASMYGESGVEVVDISLPMTKYAISVYYIAVSAEVSSNLGRYDGIRYGNDRNSFGDEAKRRIMLGSYVLSSGYYDAYYLKAMKVRSKLIEDFDEAFNEVDAILAPVSPTLPFKIGEKASDPLQMYLADIFTVSANLTGIPGLSVPAGFSKSGLPMAFQLMGPRFSESTLFDLARTYEKASGYKPEVAK